MINNDKNNFVFGKNKSVMLKRRFAYSFWIQRATNREKANRRVSGTRIWRIDETTKDISFRASKFSETRVKPRDTRGTATEEGRWLKLVRPPQIDGVSRRRYESLAISATV